MKSQVKPKIKNWPWFVLILPLVFPLLLYANNLGEVTLASLWRPVLLSLLLGGVIFGLVYLLKRDLWKAGLIAFILDLFAFSYGHIYTLVKPITIFGILVGRHRFLTPILLLIAAVLIWRVIRLKEVPEHLFQLINIIVIALFLFQFIQIVVYEVNNHVVSARNSEVETFETTTVEDDGLRDVYLIVLDAYSRSDWLAEWSGYDDSKILNSLEEMGFYVVPCSRSNYSYTIQSMTSELNMEYLQDLDVPYNNVDMSNALKNNDVRSMFSDLGYEFVFFETGYPWIEMEDADRYIKAEANLSKINDFEILYLKTTSMIIPYDMVTKYSDSFVDLAIERHVERVISVFEHLQQPLDDGKPMFVYAHIVSPHAPAAFRSDGSINYYWESDSVKAYQDTYSYVDSEI